MTKIFLSLQTNHLNENPTISITKTRSPEPQKNVFLRSSPLYSYEEKFSFLSLEAEFNGQILLLFTSQVNDTFHQLKQFVNFIPDKVKAYISHGFASIILFVNNDVELFKNDLCNIPYLVGYEKWIVFNNKIIDSENHLPEFRSNNTIDLNFDLLCHEERFIFSDILSSLNQAFIYSDVLLKPYLPVLNEVKRKVLDFYYRSLFLNGNLKYEEFENKIKEVNIDNLDYVEYLLHSYVDIEKKPNKIEHVFIKDEIIQIASVLKNSNIQLFGNIPVLKYGMFQPGKNSLLGIGTHVVGFLSIYLHLRKCFSSFDFDEAFDTRYSECVAPPFLRKPDLESYSDWYWSFTEGKGLDEFLVKRDVNTTYIMLYYSNRQGFRFTKHSVSAAMQSLYLSFLPTFTLNTITHELLHAHVRSQIMVEFYPLILDNHEYLISTDVFTKYKKLFESTSQNFTIKEFIQINFLLIGSILKENGNTNTIRREIKKSNHKDVLTKTLRTWHKEVEEIIVHILDLHYFYNSDKILYVKAIWISWFSLPFSINNLRDYILRSICAISSLDETTDRLERFDLAVELLKNELAEIKKCEWVVDAYVDITLKRLEDTHTLNDLRYYYVNAFVNLVDITKKYFFSGSLKAELNFDREMTESDSKENEFTFDFEIGKFENRTIESPISAINEINSNNIYNFDRINTLDKDEIERSSVWLNSLIATALKKDIDYE